MKKLQPVRSNMFSRLLISPAHPPHLIPYMTFLTHQRCSRNILFWEVLQQAIFFETQTLFYSMMLATARS